MMGFIYDKTCVYNIAERVVYLTRQPSMSKLCRVGCQATLLYFRASDSPLTSSEFTLFHCPNKFVVKMNSGKNHFDLSNEAMKLIGDNIETYFEMGSHCDCGYSAGGPEAIKILPEIRDDIFAIRSSVKCDTSVETPTHRLHVNVAVLAVNGDAFNTDYGFILTSRGQEKNTIKNWIKKFIQ